MSQNFTVAKDANVDMGGNVIQNVAPGVNGTDAVNVNQLNQTNQNINKLREDVFANQRESRAGIAGAMAAVALPQATTAGADMVTAAVGGFKGEAALAVGMSKMSDNNRWAIKAHVTANTNKDVGVGFGMGYHVSGIMRLKPRITASCASTRLFLIRT